MMEVLSLKLLILLLLWFWALIDYNPPVCIFKCSLTRLPATANFGHVVLEPTLMVLDDPDYASGPWNGRFVQKIGEELALFDVDALFPGHTFPIFELCDETIRTLNRFDDGYLRSRTLGTILAGIKPQNALASRHNVQKVFIIF